MKRPKPYDLTTHGGKTVDWLTKAALMKMERILGYELTVVQGSYHKGVGASAGTHDGGGAVDLAPWDAINKVRAGRLSGFVIYDRPAIPGVWPHHVHGILECNERKSPAAQRQCNSYHLGENGLADRGPDPHKGMVFRAFVWPYSGPIGAIRWQRDQLRGKKRADFIAGLKQVARGK